MNPQDWTVIVVSGAKEWSGKHGPMIDYYINLEGYTESVTLTQKPDTEEPRVGDTIYGHVEVLDRRKRNGEPFTVHKLKKDRREDGEWQKPSVWSPESVEEKLYDASPSLKKSAPSNGDNRSARIERQHSQEMAIRLTALLHPQGYPRDNDLAEEITIWTDWFCADLDKHTSSHGSQQNTASSKTGTTPASTGTGGGVEPPPTRLSDDEAKRLAAQAAGLPEDRVALELVSAGARDISDISKAIRSLSPAQASQFAASLDNIAEEQRHIEGQTLGVGAADDSEPPF